MILKNYPKTFPKNSGNYIIHLTSANSEIDKHISSLSLKCTLKGQENFRTSSGIYSVTPGNYFIMNEGQECESRINIETESFSLFFDTKFADSVLKSLITPSDKILNYSYFPGNLPLDFFEKIYTHNNFLSPLIMKMHLASKVNYDDSNWINEHFYLILEKLLIIHKNLFEEINKLPPIKLSTKIEIYKRVCRAKEYMDTIFTSPVSLEEISKEACLSPFHFLRLFKTIYKETPHQYLTKKRMSKALQLLSKTDMSVTEVCFEIGFESMSSFSSLVRKKFGLSPELLRNEFKKFHHKYRVSN